MARRLRLEMAGGIYPVINRGNDRAPVFRADQTKEAFLECLGEACGKTGWRIHAWCLMSNHYHLAVETPEANLVDGMKWLQGTFSLRFNRHRGEHGHLFQGRYKSPVVEAEGLGALCHYIHLNPVRAKLCAVNELSGWRWTSFHWLQDPRKRPAWYGAEASLAHAGGLADTRSGRAKYTDYLAWLNEDEPARKALNFGMMSAGWAIGSSAFKKTLLEQHREVAAALDRGEAGSGEAKELLCNAVLDRLLKRARRTRDQLGAAGKSEPWKVALGAALKAQTTATNRWLAEHLHLGHPDEVSRKISQCRRPSDGT